MLLLLVMAGISSIVCHLNLEYSIEEFTSRTMPVTSNCIGIILGMGEAWRWSIVYQHS